MIPDKDLYSQQNKYAHFFLYGPIQPTAHRLFIDFVQQVELTKSIKAIIMHIDSPGGAVSAMSSIVNTMKLTKVPIISIVEGNVISAATCIFMSSNYRVMSYNSIFMTHQMSYTMSGMHDDIVTKTHKNNQIMDNLTNCLRKHTKLTEKMIEDLLGAERVLPATECLKYGICDRIYQQQIKKFKTPDNIPLLNTHIQLLDIGIPTLQMLQEILLSKEIILRINSVYEKAQTDTRIMAYYMSLINTIRNSHCIVYGVLESIGTHDDILVYLACDYRFIMDNALITLDFSNIKTYMGRSPEDLSNNNKVSMTFIRDILDKHTKLPKDIKDKVFKENVSLTPKDAIKYGLANKII